MRKNPFPFPWYRLKKEQRAGEKTASSKVILGGGGSICFPIKTRGRGNKTRVINESGDFLFFP